MGLFQSNMAEIQHFQYYPSAGVQLHLRTSTYYTIEGLQASHRKKGSVLVQLLYFDLSVLDVV